MVSSLSQGTGQWIIVFQNVAPATAHEGILAADIEHRLSVGLVLCLCVLFPLLMCTNTCVKTLRQFTLEPRIYFTICLIGFRISHGMRGIVNAWELIPCGGKGEFGADFAAVLPGKLGYPLGPLQLCEQYSCVGATISSARLLEQMYSYQSISYPAKI